MSVLHFHDRGDGVRLAYRRRRGHGPTLVFLPGYMSDMDGSKALTLDQWAALHGHACLRFDYSGCGQSDGDFAQGSISRWTDDALSLVDALAPGPLLLVGSSMGGWVALHLALRLRARVRGLIGIAAAPDFTDWGIIASMNDAERAELAANGRLTRPSDYGPEPYVYTQTLIEDGQAQRLLTGTIALDCPVRLLHGQQDSDVPWTLSLRLAERLGSADVQLTLVKDGDHRLSRDRDLALLLRTVAALLEIA